MIKHSKLIEDLSEVTSHRDDLKLKHDKLTNQYTLVTSVAAETNQLHSGS